MTTETECTHTDGYGSTLMPDRICLLCEQEIDPEPLWGPDGPTEGQVIPLRDIPGVRVRWTGGHWEMVE